MESVKGKTVLLVGATGSIGHQTALLLAKSGAQLYLTGRNPEKLNRVAQEAQVPYDRVFAMDIAQADSVKATMDKILALSPVIDILINATGIGIIKTMDSLTATEFEQTLQVNLTGSFYVLQAILPAMKALKKGLIIHVPGVLGKVPMAGAAAYSASKYGLRGMLQSIREELKRTDIRITQLFLGGVDSAFWDNIDLRVQRDKMILADEAAKAIWFLCQQ
ncbi:MAG: SDR family oxidoreductase, partial [Sphingobacteriia bacterium]